MKLTLTRDPEEFAARTRQLLESRIENNLIATVLAGVLAGHYQEATPLFASGSIGGEVTFAALRTPPWGMLATYIDAGGAQELIDAWLKEDPELPRVGAPDSAARTIAKAWADVTGGATCCQVRELRYVLERVIDPPRPAPGTLRLAREDERAPMLKWMKAFARETRAFPEERAQMIVDTRMATQGLHVWDHDGAASMLCTAGPIAGSLRIGPVYTPPERRRRGYAGTAVAAASRQALERGARRCLLFTDATNPTSNKIYAEVGYRQFGEYEEWELERGPSGADLGAGP